MKPFSCIKCGQRIPFRRVFSLSNFTIIICSNCGEELRPKLFHSALSGGIIGMVTALSVSLVGLLFMKKLGLLIGLLAGVLAGIVVYLFASLILVRTIMFEKAHEKHVSENSQN